VGSEQHGVTSYEFSRRNDSITFSRSGDTVQAARDVASAPARATGLTAVEARYVGSWACTCKITIVLNADRTGSFVDGRGGPAGSLYESGTFKGTWSATATAGTLEIPVAQYGRRGGSVQLTFVDGKLRDQFGDVYSR
jgi:hypothetical protein